MGGFNDIIINNSHSIVNILECYNLYKYLSLVRQ